MKMKMMAVFLALALVYLAPLGVMGEPLKNFDLAAAQQVAQASFDCAKTKGIAISVAIVNSEGNLMIFLRNDKAYVGSISASMEKAKSANAFRRPTSAFAQSIKDGRIDMLSLKDIVAIAGGVPIEVSGQFVGAIGISGGRAVEDEECALEALKVLKK